MTLRWARLSVVLVVLAPGPARGQSAAPPSAGSATPSPVAPDLDATARGLAATTEADRVAAVRALSSAGPAAVPHLVRTLEADPSPEVRGWAARGLGAAATREAMAALTASASRDPDERVRILARRLAGLPEPIPAPPAPPPPPTAVPAPAVDTVVYAPPPAPPRRPRIPGRGLITGGWTTFGCAYLTALLVASAIASDGDPEGWYFAIPVVGPAATSIALGADAGFGVLYWLWTGVQAGAVAMLAVGHVRYARYRRELEEGPARATARRSIALAPAGPGDLPGLTLHGSF